MGIRNRYGQIWLLGIIWVALAIGTLHSSAVNAANFNLPYSGRLVEDNGRPLDGPVDIVVEFYKNDSGGEAISGPHVFSNVGLEAGVFQLNFSLPKDELNTITGTGKDLAWIQIVDATNGVTYPRQRLAVAPFALKIPVDGETIGWNSNGELELKGNLPSTQLGEHPVNTSGAAAGQVLTWDANDSTWKPMTVPVGNTFSVADIPTGGITDDKIASAAITYEKIAHPCSAGKVLQVPTSGSNWTCVSIGSGSGDINNNGNATGQPITIGTDDAQPLNLETNDQTVLTVDAAGQVGIGTQTPNAVLDVTGASGIRAEQICDESGSNCKDISGGWGGDGTVTSVAMSVSGTGISVTGGPVTGDGSFTLGLTNDLAAVEGISTTGIAVRTGVDTWGTITNDATNWDLAYTDRLKWDGGATGLNPATARMNLGLEIGTNIQAYDPELADVAGLTPTADNFIMGNGSNFGLVTGGAARSSLGAAASGANADITSLANLDNDSVSGDKVSGGTIDTFASTGIDDNAAATAVTIDAAGQVGVGTASPNAALDVAGPSGIRAARLCDELGSNCKDISAGWSASGTSEPIFTQCTNANSLDSNNTACFAAATNGGIGTNIYRASNCSFNGSAIATGDLLTWSGSKWEWRNFNGDQRDCDNGSLLVLKLDATGGSYTTQWDDATGGINYGSGNVGIGTTSPNAALDVAGSTGIRAEQICDESGSNCKDISAGWGSGGSVTSVAMTVPTGLSVTGGPVTSAGTFNLGLTNDLAAVEGISGTGIAVRTGVDTWGTITDNSTNWDLAFTDRLKWNGGATGLDAAAGRASLGLQIGSDVQAYDAQLTDVAGLTPLADNFIMGDGTNFGLVNGSAARMAIGAAASGANSDITSLTSLLNDSISGDKVSGGTIDTFTSTGIDDNAAATSLTIDAIGQVGVGTASPNSSLEVAGMVHSTLGGFKLPDGTVIDDASDIGGSTTSALFQNWPDAIVCNTTIGGGAYESPHFLAQQVPNINRISYRFVTNGDTFYDVSFNLSTGAYHSQTGWSSNDCANKSISTLVSEGRAKYFGNDIATVTNDDDGDTKIMVEKTTDEDAIRFDTAGSERAIIDATGNVGIGTPTPNAALDVAGATGIRAQQICDESGSNCKDISAGWGSGGSVTSVAMTVPTGLSVTGGPITTAGTFSLELTNDLAAIEGISGTGITVRTGVDTWGTITDNSTNWDLAFTDRLKWNGSAAGLNTALARNSLGLQIGSDVQAYDTGLTDLAGLNPTANNFIMGNGSNFGLASGSSARTALGAAASGTNSDITSLTNLNPNSLSGSVIHGGTIGAFRSTGIDDNANSLAITIDLNERVGIGDTSPDAALDVAGSSGIRAEQICDESGDNCKDLSAGWEVDLGTWDSSKNFNTVYQATTSGFVVFTASSPANDSHTYLTGQTNPSPNPTSTPMRSPS